MGRSKRLCFLILLLASTAGAQHPAHIDSLIKYTSYLTNVNVRTSDSGAWRWAVNTAVMQICDEMNAYPKLDTITMRQDSTGAALNNDFLRINFVSRLLGDSMFLPMGEVRGDTVYLQVVDTGDVHQDKSDLFSPRLYITHGVADTARLLTHPKVASDTLVHTFIVAYWARDTWLRPTTAGDTLADSLAISNTKVMDKYRDDVVVRAAQIIKSRRLGLSAK